MSLNNGERQVAQTIDGIRRDHAARYEWVAGLKLGRRIIDAACGIGYGSQLMAETGFSVLGLDRDAETIAYAERHYGGPRVKFQRRDLNEPDSLNGLGIFDLGVTFETIEHLEDPAPFLRALRKSCRRLVASVPNEEVFPFLSGGPNGYAFHFRHYTRAQFEALLSSCGWKATAWYGQQGMESDVEPECNGRTLVAIAEPCEAGETVEPPASELPAISPPGHVAILGLGPSINDYLELSKRLGGRHKICDQVWAINALGAVFDCDLIWHMDDVRIQEIRAEARPDSNIAAMLPWLRECRVPVMSSRAHPDYPAIVEFPLQAVLNAIPYPYFNSTAAYAVAYAVAIGVKHISLYGIDYTLPNSHHAEKGRGCVEFWMGIAGARGIGLTIAKHSTLMDAQSTTQDRLYGYDTVDVELKALNDFRFDVSMTPKETLPTADEIEARYDHNAHPNALVASGQT